MQAIDEITAEDLPHGKISRGAYLRMRKLEEERKTLIWNSSKWDSAYTVDGGRIDAVDYENVNAAHCRRLPLQEIRFIQDMRRIK